MPLLLFFFSFCLFVPSLEHHTSFYFVFSLPCSSRDRGAAVPRCETSGVFLFWFMIVVWVLLNFSRWPTTTIVAGDVLLLGNSRKDPSSIERVASTCPSTGLRLGGQRKHTVIFFSSFSYSARVSQSINALLFQRHMAAH